MANTTVMTYGSYSFTPVPLITLSKEFQKSDDGTLLGTVFVINLTGTLTPLPAGEGGLEALEVLQTALRDALDVDGKHFEVLCDTTTLISVYPRLRSISFDQSNNNWVFTTPFTVELEFDDEPSGLGENSSLHPPYIESANEEWTLEFVQEEKKFTLDLSAVGDQQGGNYYGDDTNPFQLRLTHNVSAKGKRHYSLGSLDKPAWEQAKEYVVDKLGYDNAQIGGEGVLNLDISQFGPFNHIRQQEIGELNGEFSVTESWMVLSTGAGIPAGGATEQFNINVRSGIDTGLTTVGIDGTIQGLEVVDYGSASGDFNITTEAFSAAETYWASVQARLLSRAQLAGESTAVRDFNPAPLSKSVGRSPSRGIITYTYEYNDRPCAFITGALTEIFNIQDNHPAEVFASLTVLGRSRGPVLQDLSTVTQGTREITIEAVMTPSSGCTSISQLDSARPSADNIDNILCGFQTQLTGTYDQVFLHANTESWTPSNGRYTRRVGWTFSNCTGPVPSTDFC